MTSSYNLLQSTVARNLDANKNAPLNLLSFTKNRSKLVWETGSFGFMHLLREYVSRGGGVRR
jgi:hypothetical protein